MAHRRGWCLIKHKWGPWEYISDDSCQEQRFCLREHCLVREERKRIYHDWGKWIKTRQRCCIEERKCRRCGEPETRMGDHEWGEWKYIKERSCIEIHWCGRCGIHKLSTDTPGRQFHQWGKWQYEHMHSCTQYRLCERCKKRETRSPRESDHQWGPWETEKCPDNVTRSVRYCIRCNTLDEKATIDEEVLAITVDD